MKIGPLIRMPKPHVRTWERWASEHTRGKPEGGASNSEFLILRFVFENYEFMQSGSPSGHQRVVMVLPDFRR